MIARLSELEHYLTIRVPMVNKQVSQIIIAIIAILSTSMLLYTGHMSEASGVSLVTLVIGYYFGAASNSDKPNE